VAGMAKIKGLFGPQRRGIQQPSPFGLNASGYDAINQNTEINLNIIGLIVDTGSLVLIVSGEMDFPDIF
jgi:hypothetical protein